MYPYDNDFPTDPVQGAHLLIATPSSNDTTLSSVLQASCLPWVLELLLFRLSLHMLRVLL